MDSFSRFVISLRVKVSRDSLQPALEYIYRRYIPRLPRINLIVRINRGTSVIIIQDPWSFWTKKNKKKYFICATVQYSSNNNST